MTDATTAGPARARRILARAKTIVVIDWPSRDVPESLAAAGFEVIVKGGPGPADYTVWEPSGGAVATRPLGRAPGRADLVYCHRPLGELPSIIAMASGLGATALWRQTGRTATGDRAPDGCWAPPEESARGRELAAAAGLAYLDDVYIADAARALTAPG